MRRAAFLTAFCLCFLALGAVAQLALAAVGDGAVAPAATDTEGATAGDEAATVETTGAATSGGDQVTDGPAVAIDGDRPSTGPTPETETGTQAPRIGETLTLALSTSSTLWGSGPIIAGGQLSSNTAAQALTIQRRSGAMWVDVASGATNATGGFSISVGPDATWTLRAHMDDDSATSPTRVIKVLPRLTITSLKPGPIFLGAALRAKVQPASYAGRITIAIRYAGRWRGRVRKRPMKGVLVVSAPTAGLGSMKAVATLPAANGLSARTIGGFRVTSTHRTLSTGSIGTHVAGLERRLRQLRFHTPGSTTRFDYRLGDVVLAFHKSRHMARNRVVDTPSWHALAIAPPMRARHAKPFRHIEIDKQRQILMVVRGGKVKGTLHVSTGATGNTPVGFWRIYQMGGSYLYKFMAFVGNFGIHGYVPVPNYPASHGCVRQPMWAAAWTFSHSRIGDRVIIY